jgi:D-xylose 1-dehydrogenase (NADP+, D-xylono-1,5-lactone-forming)
MSRADLAISSAPSAGGYVLCRLDIGSSIADGPATEPRGPSRAARVAAMTDRPVRWGILSTANISLKVLAGARKTDAVEVVAVGSRDRAKAEAYAAKNGIPRAHGSYEELLADPEVEAVYIATPNSLHHPNTMQALRAGKHVLAEKPYTRHPTEVTEAFDAADAAGLVLSEGFMWRRHPQVEILRSLLPELGTIHTIRSSFSWAMDDVSDARKDVRLDPAVDGSSLLDVGTYCVSGSRFVAGEEPDRVFGFSEVGPTGVDVRFTGLMHFPSGTLAEFSCGFRSEHRGLEPIGTKGALVLTDPWQSDPATMIRDSVETALPIADPYQLELEDVSRAIRTGEPPLIGRADAMGQARALDALLRSSETGLPVDL